MLHDRPTCDPMRSADSSICSVQTLLLGMDPRCLEGLGFTAWRWKHMDSSQLQRMLPWESTYFGSPLLSIYSTQTQKSRRVRYCCRPLKTRPLERRLQLRMLLRQMNRMTADEWKKPIRR